MIEVVTPAAQSTTAKPTVTTAITSATLASVTPAPSSRSGSDSSQATSTATPGPTTIANWWSGVRTGAVLMPQVYARHGHHR